MKGVIDSSKGEYVRCLLENGEIINIHVSEFDKEVKVGDNITISLTVIKDEKAD